MEQRPVHRQCRRFRRPVPGAAQSVADDRDGRRRRAPCTTPGPGPAARGPAEDRRVPGHPPWLRGREPDRPRGRDVPGDHVRTEGPPCRSGGGPGHVPPARRPARLQ